MINTLKITLLIVTAIVFEIVVFPSHFAPVFKPNLLIPFIVFLGFRVNIGIGAVGALLLGLVQDSINGIYFGLNGFSCLLIFIILKGLAHRLYTDSRALMVVGVLLSTVFNSLLNLLLLMIFSGAEGIYASILPALLPHSLINAVAAYFIFGVVKLRRREDTV